MITIMTKLIKLLMTIIYNLNKIRINKKMRKIINNKFNNKI